jgi:hypothetical protein
MPSRICEYSVDVWFLYGSFSHGLEARVCTYGAAMLTLDVSLQKGDSELEVANFLDSVLDDPRGLLRTELRVYGPEDDDPSGGEAMPRTPLEPVRLYTEVAPGWALASGLHPAYALGGRRTDEPAGPAGPAAPLGPLRLRFSGLTPATPGDEQRWRHLVTRVWPNMTSP